MFHEWRSLPSIFVTSANFFAQEIVPLYFLTPFLNNLLMVSLCEALKIIQGHIPIHFDTDLFLLPRAVVGPYQVHGELEKENIRTLGHNRQRRFFFGAHLDSLASSHNTLSFDEANPDVPQPKTAEKICGNFSQRKLFSLFDLSLCPFALIEKALR